MLTNIEIQGSESKPAVSLRMMSSAGPRFLWLLTCLILVAGLAASASAQIVESREWLVKKTEHRILDEFGAIFGWPDPDLPKGQAVLYVYVTGRSYRVLAVGPTSSDAKQYAEKLRAWRDRHGLSGAVQYSQEDDCAAADFSQSVMGLGRTELRYTIPLASLYREVRLEDTTHFGLVVNGVAKLPSDFPEPDRTKPLGHLYWNLSSWEDPMDATITVKLDWWVLPLFVLLALVPLAYTGTVYVRARRIARDLGLPLSKRREMFISTEKAAVRWMTAASILIFIGTVFSQAFSSLSDLWLTSYLEANVILLALGVLSVFSLPFVLKAERDRLLQACQHEIVGSETEVHVSTPLKLSFVRNPLFTIVKGVAWLAALAIALAPTTKADEIHDYKYRIALSIFVMAGFIPDKKYISPEPAVIQDEAELRQKIKELIAKVELLEPSLIKEFEISPNSGASIHVYLWDGKLTVSEGALRRLNLEELEFCVFEKHFWHWITEPPVMPTLGSAFAAIIWLISWERLRWIPVPLYVALAILLISPFLYYIVRVGLALLRAPKNKLKTDLLVIQATGNPSAAISALQRQHDFLRTDTLNYGYNPKPTYSERIARIRAAFPETSSAPAAE